MGLFKKQKAHKSVEISCLELCSSGRCEVVGESHYQDALLATSRSCTLDSSSRRTFTAVLVREPTNSYDPNAVAVWSPAGRIGYLSRDDAAEYQDVLMEVQRRGY